MALFKQAFLSGALFGLSLIVGFTAVLDTSVANATLINNMMPVIVVLIAHFVFRERVRARQFVAVAVSVVGLMIVVLARDSSGDASLWGDFLAVVNLGIWTWYFLRTKRLRDEGVESWSLIATITVVAGMVAVPLCLVMSDDLGAVHGIDWLYLVSMVVGPGVLGHGLMTWAAKHLAGHGVGAAHPRVADRVRRGSLVWLDQSMNLLQVVGAAIVLAALGRDRGQRPGRGGAGGDARRIPE